MIGVSEPPACTCEAEANDGGGCARSRWYAAPPGVYRWKRIAWRFAVRARNWRLGFVEMGAANAKNVEAKMQAEDDLRQLRIYVDGLLSEWEHLIAEVDRPKVGMRVPFHSQWASAQRLPSVLTAIRRWTRDLRELLPREGRS